MNDPAEFLLARIAEDQAAAKAAAADLIGDGRDTATQEWFITYDAMNLWPSHLDHIARWDPARVLAECEAKRRIVELMVNEVKDARRRPGWTLPDSEMDEKGRDYRAGFENARAQQLPDVLDRTDRLLRLLALPYADHPDYREEWRP